jgi:hypothetical protein
MSDESKSDDNSPVKPQVIDLEAEDVTVESDPPREEPSAPPPHTPPRRKSGGSATWIIAALVLGLIGGGWLYRDVLSTYLPTDEMTALKGRIDVLEANGKTQGEQLLAVSQSSDAASTLASGLDKAVKDVAAGVADAQSRIRGFETRIAETEKALKSAKADLDALRSAVSSGASSGAGPVDSAALAAIGQRIDALEKDMASLKSRGGAGDGATATAALSQALSDIKAKIASGVAFADEYDRIARMVPAAAGLDVLAAHASAGLPDAPGLGAELRATIPALPKPAAENAPAGDSYWDTIWGALSGIITIRDIGEADWPTLAEKASAFAEAGDLPQAIALIDAAEGAKPSAISQWRDRAVARLKLEAALDTVSQAVLRQIAALGGAQ